MQLGHFWGHTFLQDRIRQTDTVFDVGMNYGGFSKIVAPLCRRVIGYEPNEFWDGRRPSLPANVTIVNKAIAATKGLPSFQLDFKRRTEIVPACCPGRSPCDNNHSGSDNSRRSSFERTLRTNWISQIGYRGGRTR